MSLQGFSLFRHSLSVPVLFLSPTYRISTFMAILPSILFLMLGISTLCLHHEPLPQALEKLAAVTGYIEVMDEGLHRLETSEPLLSCSCMFSIHAPCRGTNLASLLEPIRRASVVVMEECFAIAAEVNAPVVVHPGYLPGRRSGSGPGSS